MVRVAITGAGGRMGTSILKLAMEDGGFEIAGVLEAKDHPFIGKVMESVKGRENSKMILGYNLAEIIERADVVIDFSEASASLEYFRVVKTAGKAIVIGTTGFSEAALAEINDGGRDAKVVISPNMSIGMNLMFNVVEKVAETLQDGYDVEIVEMHHRMKRDAPSGTAVRLKNIVESVASDKKWIEVYGRKGITGERQKEEIGVLALRGGDVVGEHTVMFAGIGERLEITHRAFSRDNFAKGSLLAAKWIVFQENGVYTMKDVLGL
jgi:4-hydroxy-tetrahydrodipicolinate reductase